MPKHNSNHSVVYVGDCGVDVINQLTTPGGCGLNFATHLASLNESVSLLSWLGTDKFASIVTAYLHHFPINISHLHQVDGATAKQIITTDQYGNRHFEAYEEGVLKNAVLNQSDKAFIKQHITLVTLYYSQINHLFNQLQQLHFLGLKVVDFMDGFDFGKDINFVKKYLAWFDVAVFGLNAHLDASLITQIKTLASQTGKLFIVTLGSAGSRVFVGGKTYFQPALKIKAVDATGCGDAFLAGFLHGYLPNHNTKQALVQATKLAAQAATHPGGVAIKENII